MVETIRLEPHDPIPDEGRHVLVFRHMGEDDPGAVVTEIVTYGKAGTSAAAVGPDGHALDLEQAMQAAQDVAERHELARVYVLDRTAGKLEQEALHDHGARAFANDVLEDSDPEDGGQGSDIRDRPHDAGYVK